MHGFGVRFGFKYYPYHIGILTDDGTDTKSNVPNDS